MSNLEAKDKISAWQLSLMIFAVIFSVNTFITGNELFTIAGQYTWISLLAGGCIYIFSALLMLQLGMYFPEESFVYYLPKAVGRLAGNFIIWYFILILFLDLVFIIRSFSNVIVFYLFDRTPIEMIALVMLVLCVYCAVQDFGTILRILSALVFLTYLPLLIIWFTITLGFETVRVLPILPAEGYYEIAKGAVFSWKIYGGYEIILFLLPFVYRGEINIFKSVATGMAIPVIIYTLGAFVLIGVLSTANILKLPYPVITAVKDVYVPGTFIERLESFLLVEWIPVVFQTAAFFLFAMAWTLKQYFGFSDHRPFLPAICPVLFLSITIFDRVESLKWLLHVINYMGIAFSLIIIPAALVFVWWRYKRGFVHVQN